MLHVGRLFKVGLLSGCPDFYCDTFPQPKGCMSCVVINHSINKSRTEGPIICLLSQVTLFFTLLLTFWIWVLGHQSLPI